MSIKAYEPPRTTTERVATTPEPRRLPDPWVVATNILWNVPVVAAGILVGAVVALFLGLFLDWIEIAC